MSAATAHASPSAHSEANAHRAHSSHPDSLRLRAISLWCEGLRSPAIATQLGVPERTIRSWLAEARADFQTEHGETVQETIALAVERQLALAAAAWQSYHHAVELEQLALDYYHAGLNRTARLKNIDDELPPPPPRPSTAPARYLSVAMAAHREAARLSGCYDLAKARAIRQAQPHFQPRPLTYAETRGLDPADERAWDAFLRQLGLSPAHFAGPADLDELYRPAWEALRRRLHFGPPARAPHTPQTPLPAKTAAAPSDDLTESEPPIPAESATGVPSPAHGGTGRGAASDHTGAERPRSERPESGARVGVGAPLSAPPIPARTATYSSPLPLASGSPFPSRREGGQGVRSTPSHPWQHIM